MLPLSFSLGLVVKLFKPFVVPYIVGNAMEDQHPSFVEVLLLFCCSLDIARKNS